MKHFYLAFLMGAFPVFLWGQSEYIITDSSKSAGIKLIDGGALINSQYCRVKKGNETFDYSPYEVKEYGLKNGKVYVSRSLELRDTTISVFLEQLNKGNLVIYYYRHKGIKTYYLEKNNTGFAELPKKNTSKETYKKQLVNITKDCPNISSACELVSYNKRALSSLIDRYNLCEMKPFPHFRYGPMAGYSLLRLMPVDHQQENLTHFSYKYDGGFSAGLFMDQPMLVSNFSWHTELLFSKHGYSYSESVSNIEVDLVANLSIIKVPVLIRYTCPTNKIRPFVNLGLIGLYAAKHEMLLYETAFREDIIEINNIEIASPFSDLQLGIAFGTGIEFSLTAKNSIFIDLRFSRQNGKKNGEFKGTSAFDIFTGINF